MNTSRCQFTATTATAAKATPKISAQIRSTSVPMKNCSATKTPSRIPPITGRPRCVRTRLSSTATISGGIAAMPSIRWASLRLTSTIGEKP